MWNGFITAPHKHGEINRVNSIVNRINFMLLVIFYVIYYYM